MLNGVPPGRQGNTFANFDLQRNPEMKPALDACKEVAEGKRSNLLLWDLPGRGKTHLAIAAMWQFDHLRSRFWLVSDFLDWLKLMAYDDDGPRYDLLELLRPYREQDFLLVLDDLGVENGTPWAREQLYRVLDSRCSNALPTIITTNAPLEKLDGRIISRYRAGLVACGGVDVRGRKGA